MNDSKPATLPDETVSDQISPPSSKQEPKKRFVLMIGGVGCVLVLCVSLLVSGGVFFVREASTALSEDEAVALELGEPQQTGLFGEIFGNTDEASTETANHEADPTSVSGAPEMSPITFALETTEIGEPVEAGFSFAEGTTRLYAVFEYAHLTPNHTWTQVWYHDGNEVSSTSQPWLEAESGVFGYVIEAGDVPLPPGEWALEFYVDNELLTAGSFMIESADEPAEDGDPPDLTKLPKIYLLAYTKWNGEKHDLYLNNTNGSQEQFILGRAAGPSWSGDSRYIFVYGEEGIDQLYPQSGVTNGIMRLTAAALPAKASQILLYQGHGWNDGTARGANVAPNGTMIAYDGDRGGGRRIYFLGTAANQQFRYEIIGEQADWSPDSMKIVYRSGRNNQTGIWISNRNDTGHIRITSDGSDSFPTWSPDGQTIAFSRDAGGNVDIYTVNVDGSNLKRLTDTPGHDSLPAYLPNGDLVFRSSRSGRWGIWKMKEDGSEQTEIIPNAPIGPDWSFSKMSVLR